MDPETPVVVVAPSAPPEQAAEVAAATVEVATIEAERDIALAQEATKQVEIVADASVTDDEDMIWLRGELADLRGQCVTNAEELSQQRAATMTMAEQMQQMSEQITVLTAAAVLANPDPNPPEPNPLTPEPDLEPNPQSEGGEGQGVQNPPTNPEPPAKRRERKWL